MIMNTKNNILSEKLFVSIGSLILALILSAILMLVLGYSPIEAYTYMLYGIFGNTRNLATTLGAATPLIFAGLAMAVGDQAGVFNIGGEGQIVVGAMAAAAVGQLQGLPPLFHIPLCMASAAAAGGIWAAIAALLKVKMNINEVIVTIMLNYVAVYFVGYLVMNPFKAEGMTARTDTISDSAVLPSLVRNTRLNAGIFIAVAFAVILWFMLKHSAAGYELRCVGHNPSAAETAGIRSTKYIYLSLFVSGAIAGIGGAVEVMGIHHYYIADMTANYGYDGIAVAVMGGDNPIGTVISALIFGALKAGSSNMNRMTDIPADLISVLQAFVIILVATPYILTWIVARTKRFKKIQGGKWYERSFECIRLQYSCRYRYWFCIYGWYAVRTCRCDQYGIGRNDALRQFFWCCRFLLYRKCMVRCSVCHDLRPCSRRTPRVADCQM